MTPGQFSEIMAMLGVLGGGVVLVLLSQLVIAVDASRIIRLLQRKP